MENHETIALGHEAKLFLSSSLGRYITERANIELDEAYAKLEKIDCHDYKMISRYQNIIHMYKTFGQWIDDAAMAGDVAYSEYLDAEE
jgi:hypothetical protein